MRRLAMVAVGWGGLALTGAAHGQTHKVRNPDAVVRAVAVYEWTGEEGKPTASRVVPVSLYVDGAFQDAAIYLARPVPLALDTGTVYEVRKAGVDAGTLEVAYERHVTSGDGAAGDSGQEDDTAEIDDGWLGYGAFKPKPVPVFEAKKQTKPPAQVAVNGNAPHFGSSSTTGAAAGDDADRPSFHKRESSGDDSSTASPAGGPDAESDADRPTLKRRSPAERKADQKKKDSARVVAGNDLNDDPDRPTLHRGSAARTDEEENPPLRGLPKDMRQLVAVSDAKDRPEHDFARPWESADEQRDVLGKMQAFAREQLAEYKGAGPAPAAPAATPVPPAAAHGSKLKKKVAAPPPPPPPALNDEALKGYTLSYGGAATYVYMASSPGGNGVSRYVTLVAQDDPIGGLKVALASVTDSSHLDRTPWMRLVDVVDADASNRASVLMELRASRTRQFALYRVIGAKADQLFLTGSTE